MKLSHLALFVTIAEEGQIGRAAARIGMTQPAVTKNLRALETAVGNSLFQRSRTGVQLTHAGQLLLVRARTILQGSRDAERELAEFSAGAIGHLRVGAGRTMAEYLLPRIISRLLAQRPGIEVKITSALNDVLFERLRSDDLDVVVSALPASPPPGLEQQVLMHDQSVVAARAGHPLMRKRRVTLRDLSHESWVLSPRGVITREWLVGAFESHKLAHPRTTVEADSALAIIAIAANSDLLAFQPRSNLAWLGTRHSIGEISCADLRWRRPIGISWRKGSYMPHIAQLFIDSLRTRAAALAPGRIKNRP